MSLKSDKARIEFISMLISDIDLIIIRHTNIDGAFTINKSIPELKNIINTLNV